jgi:class 3 adenylate cyclase/tetratricopeptide (TPR) repeat protein
VPVCANCGRDNPAEAVFCMACAAPLSAPAPTREQRKVVTVVFCDLVGSTMLGEAHDPEVLRPILLRYYDEMRAAAERHGGVVEKFIGDAVVAVFGVPQTHEDDALRAVRAAAEMRDRLVALNVPGTIELVGRIGLTTGEVLIGGADQPPVGDTMNTSARLQTAAEPGEILIGEPTYQLVRDAVMAEPVEPLTLKGKSAPLPAYRLLQVASLSPMRTRRLDAPMIGRDRERTLLDEAFARSASDRACQLFTVLGAAGAGKSRLVEEFLAEVVDADVLRGRCLPYGDGITYFPVVEALKEYLGLADFDGGSAVRAAIRHAVAEEEDGERIVANLATLLGAEGDGAPEETLWAIRRFMEASARVKPIVVVFDDIHWGEPTFLDLVEHVAEWSRDAPILMLCMARLDLLDERPAWAGGKTNATTISLAPLSTVECEHLIDHLLGSTGLPAAVRDRITGVAEGNPLFVEEMLRMLVDDGVLVQDGTRWVAKAGDEVSVPPTISALLSARLDRLSAEERAVIEAAAVAGREFHRGALRALLGDEGAPDVDRHLRSLVRKELVVPQRSLLKGDDAYRFRHLLIRDAVYDAIPKLDRAGLHERFGAWLEGVAGDRIAEQEEILGYHLEQAYHLRTELGPATSSDLGVAARAATHLASAGRRSYERGDTAGATNLLSRAFDLPAESRDRARIGLSLAFSLAWGGAEEKGLEVARAVEALVDPLGDPALSAHTHLRVLELESWRHPRIWVAWRSTAERAIPVLTDAGDQVGLSIAWRLIAWDSVTRCRYADSDRAAATAAIHGRAAGDRQLEADALSILGNTVWGPQPVAEAIARCERIEREATTSRNLFAIAMAHRAALIAMQGGIVEGRELYGTAKAMVDELGRPTEGGFAVQCGWYIEMIAGEPARAEALAGFEYEQLLRSDARVLLDVTRDMLAMAVCAQGRLDEAEALARETEAADLLEEDIVVQFPWRRIRAVALSARGEHAEAVRLAREAAALFEGADALCDQAETLLEVATVLNAAGVTDGARDAASRALSNYERKGNLVEAERARRRLDDLAGV